jgi:flagellar biosynthetic protein FliQ
MVGTLWSDLWLKALRGFSMSPEFVITFAQDAIKTTILVASPLLGLGLIVGLTVSIFQAVTQINEMTLTFVPKILIVLLALLIFANWMLEHLIHFATNAIEQIPFYVR